MHYNLPIELDPTKQYEIGLLSCTCWNAMANVKTNVDDDISFTPGTSSPTSIKKIKNSKRSLKHY